jgi:hypothetical protein
MLLFSKDLPELQSVDGWFSTRLMPQLNGYMSQEFTQRAIVEQLNALGIRAPRGGVWSSTLDKPPTRCHLFMVIP